MRKAAGGDDDHIGPGGEHIVGLGHDVVADADAQALELGQPPVDDADQLLAARIAGEQPDLPAGFAGRLEHGHPVAPFGSDAGGFEPGRAGADHHDALGGFGRPSDGVRRSWLRVRSQRLWMQSASPPS